MFGKNKLNQSKITIIVCLLLFLMLQYTVAFNIFLMGDDFMYTVFARQGCVKSAIDFYFTGNGRWILNILDSFILLFDRYFYIIILPWLMLLFAYLLYRVNYQLTNKRNIKGFYVSLLLVSIIDVSIARETIYWITGGLNYLIPGILFLASISLLHDLRNTENCSNWRKILCGVICVISSTTMEQFSLMTIGWMTLLFAYDLFNHKKLSREEIIIYIISLVGLASIILAPGNFVRIQNQAEEAQPFLIKVIDLFYMNYYSVQAMKYVVLISLLESIILFRNKKLCIISMVNISILMMMFIYEYIPSNIIYALFSLGLLTFMTFKILKDIKNKFNSYYFFMILVLVLGAQVMLLTGTPWGFRTSFPTLITYSLFILILFSVYEDNKLFDFILCCCGFYVHWLLGCIILIYSLYKLKMNKNIFGTFEKILFLFVISGCILPVTIGYASNREVHLYNLEQTNISRNESVKNITIHSFNNEEYGWTNPPFGKFYEGFFRMCFQVPKDVEIKYNK